MPIGLEEVDIKVETEAGVTHRWETISDGVPDIENNKLTFFEGTPTEIQHFAPEYKLFLKSRI